MVDSRVRVDAATLERGDPYELIEPVWWTATFYETPAEYEASLAGFSEPQRLVWAMVWYESEVNNGGHLQFFDNSTGMVWRDALRGLRNIGASKLETILSDAGDRLGGFPSLDRAERCSQVEAFLAGGGSFEDLDDRFFTLPEADCLASLVGPYARAHAQAFLFDGLVKKPAGLEEVLARLRTDLSSKVP